MAEGVTQTTLQQLLTLYQDKLVDAINDPRHFDGERAGLRMASAIFRRCLEELEIPNVP